MKKTYTKEEARAVVQSLGLPSAVLQIFDNGGEALHSLLAHLQDPYYLFSAWESIPYDDIVPLWEESTVITAYDRTRNGYICFSLEMPEEEWFFHTRFDGVAARVMITLLEVLDVSEEELAEVAELLAFPYLAQLLESYDPYTDYSADEYDQWVAAFLQQIGV